MADEDYGVLAWHEEGRWNIQMLDDANDISSIIDALQSKRVNGGTFALIAIDDEFFIVARALGAQMQMMISDVTYATEYDIASDLIDMLDLPMPEEDDDRRDGTGKRIQGQRKSREEKRKKTKSEKEKDN